MFHCVFLGFIGSVCFVLYGRNYWIFVFVCIM